MLYNLIEKKRGKETVVMTDSLPKVNDRLKILRASLRTKKVSFRVEKTEETDKYKKKPHNCYYLATNHSPTPNGKNLICYTIVEVVTFDKPDGTKERKLESDSGIIYPLYEFHSFYKLPTYYEPN